MGLRPSDVFLQQIPFRPRVSWNYKGRGGRGLKSEENSSALQDEVTIHDSLLTANGAPLPPLNTHRVGEAMYRRTVASHIASPCSVQQIEQCNPQLCQAAAAATVCSKQSRSHNWGHHVLFVCRPFSVRHVYLRSSLSTLSDIVLTGGGHSNAAKPLCLFADRQVNYCSYRSNWVNIIRFIPLWSQPGRVKQCVWTDNTFVTDRFWKHPQRSRARQKHVSVGLSVGVSTKWRDVMDIRNV